MDEKRKSNAPTSSRTSERKIKEEPNRTARILVLTDDLGGGTGNHLLSLIRHWDKNRWQPEIISRAPLTARVSPDVPVKYLPRNLSPKMYPLAQIRDLGMIRKRIVDNPASIVHTYFFWSILFGRILKWQGKIRTLVENREDEGFGWGAHEYAWLRMTRGLPDQVICVSDAVRRVVLEREHLDEDRAVVIRNGVDMLRPSEEEAGKTRAEFGIGKEHLVVGMVANFNRSVKGVSCFLDAVPEIVKAVPSSRFLLLGRGKEEMDLRAKALQLGIEPFVHFAGYRQDIQRYYSIMDVSALTSFSEGLSITLLESMSCGVPVVATRVGGNPEVVVEGVTGYLVPPGDVASFASKTVELLRDKELRVRMGVEARRRVERHFLLSDVASRYLQTYDTVLSSK